MKRWYMIPCLFCAAVVDPNLVRFFAAMYLGKYSFVPALIKAYRHFNLPGYLFFALFRFIPYLALIVILIAVDNSKKRNWLGPTFMGGFIGILGFMVWATWEVVAPLYTSERMASTSAISFIFIPFYSFGAGLIGILLMNGIDSIAKRFRGRSRTKPVKKMSRAFPIT